MEAWGYLTWEIHRDISVAVFLKDPASEARARTALALCQGACGHQEHPEKPGACLKCGAAMAAKPGLVSTKAPDAVACRRYTG